ncbi:LysE family translocator [Fulvimonas yonginensis]|uniref:LysE family transporter n=1 Tax=Fulvimonas yonginensis TaxID=1495200 RepID=A0ABU8J9Q9_9GAMM
MNDLFAPAGLLLAAAITPGPNNLVVLRIASRAGVRAALPAIAGIVGGSLALLALALSGLAAVTGNHPAWRTWLGAGGAAYLGWLGLRLLVTSLRETPADAPADALPATALGLFGFQLLNPKAWVMTLTVVAAWGASGARGWIPLAVLFVAIPLGCLLLWSACGRLLTKGLAHPPFRRGLDAGMGALLLASAGLLLIEH